MLRIIAGTWKNRRIEAPPGLATRPLTDRIKQSLFDWLGDIAGLRIADTCAGSGSFAFEAASRGAGEVHAVELSAPSFAVLHSNHALLGEPAAVRLYHDDCLRVLPALADLDLVFCDPPFPWFSERPDDLAHLVTAARQALAPHGIIVIRGEQGQRLPVVPGILIDERREYGRSWVMSLRRTELPVV